MRKYPLKKLSWAKAAIALRDGGIFDPSFMEIAKQYFGKGMLPSDLGEEVRQNLYTIQTILRKNYNIELVHCLGKGWYYPPSKRGQSFRKLPPQNEQECRYCSPVNRNGRYGIRFAHGTNDLMWQFMINFHLKTSGSSNRHGQERLIQGMKRKLVTVKDARQIARKQIANLVPGTYKSLGQLWNGTPNPFDGK
jgi:hypothetical protein